MGQLSGLTKAFVIFNLLNYLSADLFTSVADLQRLLHAEKDIPELINTYIAQENARLANLKSVVSKYQINNDQLQKTEQHMERARRKMRSDTAESFLQNISSSGQAMFPNDEDLSGAVIGLLRLQDTYRLDTKQLANGVVLDTKLARKCLHLTASK
uniref:Prolyl 4-hydroxylase alpha-subunit N-terminal domain-containing protein n=1 Tax=Ditylenchus dipsaci TaxID=166011 RepID=A0A915DK77_9BILA